MEPHVIADTFRADPPESTDTAGPTAGQPAPQPSVANGEEPLMENSELCLPFGTQADAIHSTTEDTDGLTTVEARVPSLGITPYGVSERPFPVSAEMDVGNLDPTGKFERYITDLVVECAATNVDHPALVTFKLIIFGLGDEGKALTLSRDSPKTWKQNDLLKLPVDLNELVIVATSEEFADFAYVSLSKDELTLGTPAQKIDNQAMTSHNGGPSLTVSFRITPTPLDKPTVEIDDHRRPDTHASYKSRLQELAHVPSVVLYMHTKRTELWNQAGTVGVCGMILQKRFEQTGDIDELSNATSAWERALQLTPDGHPDMPSRLSSFGNSLSCLFEHTSNLTDIADAISAQQRAVQLTPNGHAEMPDRLSDLGNSFARRFRCTDEPTDIANAISAQQRAVQLTPDDHADMPRLLANLGTCFLDHFRCTGDLSDIANAISFHQRAIQLVPDGHVNKPALFSRLGTSFSLRFEHTGDLADIIDGISAHQRAVQHTPNGHPDMPSRLNNLGDSFVRRFEHTGDSTDIANAISAHKRAVQLTHNSHTDMPSWLNSLGNSFLRRFGHTDDLTDVTNGISAHQKAVRLTPDGHAIMPSLLNDLGNSFLCRFERRGDPTDIANAISSHQKAVQLTPNGHADTANRLSNLGNSFVRCFERTGNLTDVANAISAHQRVVQLTPDGHAEMPNRLNNLGNSLSDRFERTGDLSDIANAVSVHQRAVHLIPDSHTNKSTLLSSLGNSFSLCFQHTGDLADITNGISAHQKAVQLTPNGHADMPSQLNNLGNSFLCRFQRTGNPTDLFNGISAHQEAVQLTPDDHANMSSSLNSLGKSLLHRFECTGGSTDIANAVSAIQRAVQLTPGGHADMPRRLNDLGNSLSYRFERTGDLADIVKAISSYRLCAIHKSGPPSLRLTAARSWAQLSLSYNPTELLCAHSVVVNLLSQVVGMDKTIRQRHSSLVEISSSITTAASAAFSQGHVEKALEWLEQGRCLVWKQLNQLRTPVDKLRAQNKLLADRFVDVSRALESSGSRQDFSTLAINGTMSQKIALEDEGRTHVMLSQDWDRILEQIRKIPGFLDFLRPRQASSIMKDLPRDGPIILINVHEDRCDALALILGCDKPLHIPLEHLTHKDASQLKDRLHKYLVSGEYLMRDADRGPREVRDPAERGVLSEILQELWLRVVKPILDALSYSPNLINPTRIWWCPTGPLAFLPIHAAGIYSQDAPPASCISDYVVSSYTPTVSALLEKLKASAIGTPQSLKILLVSQPNTPSQCPIPGTTREIDAVCENISTGSCDSLRLEGAAATVSRVKQEMEMYKWVHLACHAIQTTHEPLRSGFFLHDGRLELSEVMKQNIPQCELAFLSACQTSTGDEKLSEEAVHLAAGMLAVGYQGVVSTMWAIKDKHAPDVAGRFYEYLVKKGKNGGASRLDSANAAYALNHATQCLRKKLGDTGEALLTWVPYVHFGL